MENITLNCETITGGQTCEINASNPFITPFISSGEMLISFFLLILIILKLIEFLKSAISSVEVVRNYQGNNSPDGKEFYKI